VGYTTRGIKEDHAIGFWSVMSLAGAQRVVCLGLQVVPQAGQRDGAKSTGCAVKEFATRCGKMMHQSTQSTYRNALLVNSTLASADHAVSSWFAVACSLANFF